MHERRGGKGWKYAFPCATLEEPCRPGGTPAGSSRKKHAQETTAKVPRKKSHGKSRLSFRSRRNPHGHRLSARPRVARGAGNSRHRALRLAYTPTYRHERRAVCKCPPPRDWTPTHKGGGHTITAAACKGVRPTREPGAPLAWRSGTARLLVGRESSLGDRHEWKNGERGPSAQNSRCRPEENNRDYERPRPICEAQPRSLYCGRRQVRGPHWFLGRRG